jgi:hypothetical protein
MPVRCIFDSMAKRVVVEAAETLTVADIRDVVLRVVAAGAISFSKLFDASAVRSPLAADDLRELGRSIRQLTIDGSGPAGPIAIIVGRETAHLKAAQLADVAGHHRPMRIFRSRREGEKWLRDMGRA